MALGPYTLELADLANSVVADLTTIADGKVLKPRHNRLGESSCIVPSPLLAAVGPGDKRLIWKKNGTCVANHLLWTVERVGGPQPGDGLVTLTAFDPSIRLRTRWCQDADASIVDGVVDVIADPDFGKPILDLPAGAVDDDAISVTGPALFQQLIENTLANNGPMGLSAGSFVDAGPDVGFALNNWPMRISEMAAMLISAGALDVTLAYTAAAGEPQAAIGGAFNAGAASGVTLEYGTGAKTASNYRVVSSMDEFANRIRYFLGPRVLPNRWRGSIDATTAGVTTDPTGSQAAYGDYIDYPIYDSRGTENVVRAIYLAIFNSELAYRMVPRTTVSITPQAGLAAEPFTGYNLGDTLDFDIVDGAFGLSGTVRCYGMDIAIDKQGVEDVGELLLMEDV
jgi:hypothetical protein